MKKKTSFTKFVFKSIDRIFELPQNPAYLERKLKDVVCVSDICYSQTYPDMALDLYYLPHSSKAVQDGENSENLNVSENAAKYPVIFEIHGGGFSAGDKKYRRCLSRYYAQRTGAIVVTPNYGVGEECPCPIPMQQLTAAVNWVAENADKYNMDLSKFVVTGDSAGAYYACFLAALQDSDYLQKLFECHTNVNVTATMLNCGIYNFYTELKTDMLLKNGVCRELMGMDIAEAKKSRYFKGLTLTTHLTEKFPPTLLIYSESDVFCKGQGQALRRKLKKLRVPVDSIWGKTIFDNHTYSLIWVTPLARKTNLKIIEFLKKHFEK